MPTSNACWGIEIGSGAIKALKLERDGDELKVADFVVMPHKMVLSTPDINRDEAQAVALGTFMSQYREALKGATIAVSVPGHNAFARFAKLPPVEKKGVANLVRFEAVQQIPFPIEEVEWDYQTFASDDSPDLEVGIFAITKAKVAELLTVYGQQGLSPDIITLSPLAAYNAVAYDLSFTNDTPGTVILDIGTTATDLIVAESGKLWIRTFPLGGHNFTEALAATFKLPYGKAERLKRESETSKYKRHVFQALKPVLQELVQDVQRSISYYKDTHPEAKISRLVVCGSTIKLAGLRKLLSQQLQLEVFKLERFKKPQIEGAVAADFEAVTPNMATAYGLALQGVGLQTIGANLMPIPVIRSVLWKRKTPWFITAACIGLAAGGLSFMRPFLDNMAVARARADGSVTNSIRQTISLGQQLKSSFTESSGSKQPGFVAQNMIRLTEGRELFGIVVNDMATMLAEARAMGAGKAELPADRLPFEFRDFKATFVPPGETLGSGTDAPPGAGDDEPRGKAKTAPSGPKGALKLELTFDSPTDSRAILNETVLGWLRKSADRAPMPYSFVLIPDPTQLTPAPQQRAATPKTPGPGGSTGAEDAADDQSSPSPGFGGGRAGNRARGGAAGGSPAAGEKNLALEQLAPLPEGMTPPPVAGQTYRYVLTWYAQLRDPAPANAPDADPASSDAQREPTS